MKEFLRSLSPRAEFLVVVFGAFGLLMLTNIVLLLDPPDLAAIPPIRNEDLWRTVYQQVIAVALLGAFLGARKWTLERLGIAVDLRDTVIGVGLMVIVFGYSWLVERVIHAFAPSAAEAAAAVLRLGEPLNVVTVAVLSLVNAAFEEVFVCGYVIAALKEKRGVAVALNVSIGLRVLCHLYPGGYSILTIAPMGLLFGYWCARSGRLWPVIMAHATLNFVELMGLEGA